MITNNGKDYVERRAQLLADAEKRRAMIETDEVLHVTISFERFGRDDDDERRDFIKRMIKELRLRYPSAKATAMGVASREEPAVPG